ncbi:MAG: radical SAM protein [Oscillospiraceae bacterium]|nr:radical SAM protein [Oscillospiraceae bacterium]
MEERKKMKYCHRFHDYLYLDHYNGQICMCQWMLHKNMGIGNVINDSIESVYNSDCASHLRSTMDDQSFKFCRIEACPHLQNNDLEEISAEEYERRKLKQYYPTEINLAYDFVCNQFCETCRKTVFVPPSGYAEQMQIIYSKIAPYLDAAKRITTSGHGDPFASGHMMEVLENLRPTDPNLSILLETNGVFFDEQHWEKIKHLSKFKLEIVVTINSFDEFIYRHISRGGNYTKVIQNLDFMSRLRENNDITILSNSFVIQDRNFREIPSFIERSFINYAFDNVVLKPVYQWGTMDDDVYWFKDVLNPLHPYHQEYLEILQDPILKDSRVYNFGGDTMHESRPYPSAFSGNFIFPYETVKRNSKVVIYGAGQVGCEFVRQLNINRYCEIILWVDNSFDNECIMPPSSLANMQCSEYDYVVLATLNDSFIKEMKHCLNDMNVSEERIISI